MSVAEIEQPTDLREYIAILRARKWTILAVIALVVGLALLWSFRQTPLYQARTRLLIEPIGSGETYVPPPNLETESEVIDSVPVAEVVRGDLGLDQPAKSLLGGLSVEPVAETQVVVVSYTSEDPVFARDAANSFAESYLVYRRQQVSRARLAAQRSAQDQLREVQNQLTRVSRQFAAARRANNDTLMRSLDAQRGSLIARLTELQNQVDRLGPQYIGDNAGGQVIEAASVPSAPASPNHPRAGLFGAFFGLLGGVGVALLRDRLADRFSGQEDVETTIGAPVLAAVPKFKESSDGALAVAEKSRGAASEAYRTLRTKVQLLVAQNGVKSILVTSPSAGEGKTVTCANLAAALASAGLRVIVVSADLRRPRLEKYFDVSNKRGLSTFLSGQQEKVIVLEEGRTLKSLRILPSGPVPANPDELLASPRLKQLLKTLEQNSDVVLLDSPPALGLADTVLLGSRADATILVLDASATRKSHAVHAREELERVGGRVIGTVLNALAPSASSYYYYEYPRYLSKYEPRVETAEGNGRPVVLQTEGAPRKRSRLPFGRRK